MLHGEPRFFTNWQMDKEVSAQLYSSEPEEITEILQDWLETTGIYGKVQFKLNPDQNPQHQKIVSTIQQFTSFNFQFCKRNNFSEIKMVIIIELFHYVLRQLIEAKTTLSEDQSFENFKELLLRHAVHRPPHSCAILTFEDVKKVNLYA